MIRVAVVDDHPIARWGVEHLLRDHPRMDLVGAVGSVAELDAAGARPDVVIVDLYLAGPGPSLDAVAALAARYRVLVMSASGRPADVLAAVRAGADGYLTKRADAATFVAAVEEVDAGGFHLSSQLADIVHADAGTREHRLAPREEEVLRYIAEGYTHAQAASRMGIRPSSVDTYVKRIKAKLGLGNKADLTRKAIELGQLDAGPV